MRLIEDPREDPRYSMGQVLTLPIIMFACRLRSLRALDRLSDDALFRDNWCAFSRARTETVLCSRQMTNVLAAIDPGGLAALLPRMVKGLIRQKQLPDAFLEGRLMVVTDGTGIFASSKPHCPQCLTQQHQDGSTTYLHNMLEAKVITSNGLALSVLSEAQLNPQEGRYDKQDCESKAFLRLLPRLKEQFPREPLVHLLDALYCNGPTFRAIQDLKQDFICCFKPGSIPTLYEEARTLLELQPGNRLTQHLGTKKRPIRRVYRWLNDLEYQQNTYHFALCQETAAGATTTFAFLTNIAVGRDNVIAITTGGRNRWTIEEGFNEQKTGYELEHFCDCKTLEVMLALYLLLQIAHALMQLLARSDLLEPVRNLTFLAALLLEALRNQLLTEELFAPDLPRYQVRFVRGPT